MDEELASESESSDESGSEFELSECEFDSQKAKRTEGIAFQNNFHSDCSDDELLSVLDYEYDFGQYVSDSDADSDFESDQLVPAKAPWW